MAEKSGPKDIIEYLASIHPACVEQRDLTKALNIKENYLFTMLTNLTYQFPIYEAEVPSGTKKQPRLAFGLMRAVSQSEIDGVFAAANYTSHIFTGDSCKSQKVVQY